MFYLSRQEQAQRGKIFEEIIQLTQDALEIPEVVAATGQLGVDLAQINRDAFLPNIKRAKIDIPAEYEDSNGVAIVPVLPREIDSDFFLAWNALAPTPQRKQKLGQLIDKTPHLDISTDECVKAVQNELVELHSRTRSTVGEEIGAQVIYSATGGKNLFFSSRPIMYIDASFAVAHPDYVPGITAHEYTHAHDIEESNSVPEDVLHSAAYTELRGYFVEYTVMRYTTGIDRDRAATKIENLRRNYGMSVPPLSPERTIPERLVATLDASGMLGQDVSLA